MAPLSVVTDKIADTVAWNPALVAVTLTILGSITVCMCCQRKKRRMADEPSVGDPSQPLASIPCGPKGTSNRGELEQSMGSQSDTSFPIVYQMQLPKHRQKGHSESLRHAPDQKAMAQDDPTIKIQLHRTPKQVPKQIESGESDRGETMLTAKRGPPNQSFKSQSKVSGRQIKASKRSVPVPLKSSDQSVRFSVSATAASSASRVQAKKSTETSPAASVTPMETKNDAVSPTPSIRNPIEQHGIKKSIGLGVPVRRTKSDPGNELIASTSAIPLPPPNRAGKKSLEQDAQTGDFTLLTAHGAAIKKSASVVADQRRQSNRLAPVDEIKKSKREEPKQQKKRTTSHGILAVQMVAIIVLNLLTTASASHAINTEVNFPSAIIGDAVRWYISADAN